MNSDMKPKLLDIVDYPLSVLCKFGLYSEANPKKTFIIGNILLAMFSFLEIVMLMQFSDFKGDISEFVSNVDACGSFGQVALKLGLLIYKSDTFQTLFSATRKFPDADNSIKTEISNIVQRILQLERIFLNSVYITTVALYLPLFFGQTLIVGVWTKEFGVLYKTTLSFQALLLFVGCVCVSAFDCIFLAVCTKIVIQFKILGHYVHELSVQKEVTVGYRNKLRMQIYRHVFLLKFTKYFQEVYFLVILSEFVTIAPVMCADIYALSEGNNIQLLVTHSLAFLVRFMQLAIYCIPADYVIAEVHNISKAAFFSGWYSAYNFTLPNPLVFMIQKSQNQRNFTAGGLIEINSNTLILVLRISWSACTVMRAMKSSPSTK